MMPPALGAALDALWDAAKASPEKAASSRVVIGGRSLKLRIDARREGSFGQAVTIEIIDRTVEGA